MVRGGAAALAVRDLEVAYGGAIVALRGVSVEVPPGAVVALLGANGAGKTSLLRAVSGLLRPQRGAVTRGRVELDGERIDRLEAPDIVRRGVAQVMEGRRVFAELTVEENLRAGAHSRRDRAGVRASFDRVLAMFPVLGERRHATAGYLSGGEQQMVAIARALMAAPRLLLLDEPSLGLAPRIVAQIAETVARINADGTSILLVEQNAHMALSVAGHAYVLENGRVARSGPAAELRDDEAIRALYLGAAAAGRRSYRDLRARPSRRWTA